MQMKAIYLLSWAEISKLIKNQSFVKL